MDPTTAGNRAFAAPTPVGESEAMEFVRFCHRRRRVGWPELYDEMCAVAGRGLYRGYDADDLATIGIGFGLFQMPALAGLVARVVAEDHDRRRLSAAALRATLAATDAASEASGAALAESFHPVSPEPAAPPAPEPVPTDVGATGHGSVRIAVAAGA